MWNSILTQVVTVLDTISVIQTVDNYEKSSFSGFPAVTVVPNEEDSDFEATTERMRTYVFRIRAYQEMYSQQHPSSPGLKDADRILRTVVDDIVKEFDKPANATLSGNANTAAERVIQVSPVPSSWGYDTDRNFRVAEVLLQVKVYVDTNQLV